jgi:hypothetical protein
LFLPPSRLAERSHVRLILDWSPAPVDAPAEIDRPHVQGWVHRLLRGGSDGNARLTALTAAVLLVLLAVEGATIPFIHQQLTLHMALGLALIPAVALKLGTTGWRFARYYLRDREYVRRGPPHPLMRLLVAPLTVASTIVLFGTGVLIVAAHPQRGFLIGLHKASFIVWFGAMAVHVLGHVIELPEHLHLDRERDLPGARARSLLLALALVAGAVIAIAALPAVHHWVDWTATHQRHDG